MMQVLLQNLQL